MKSTPKNNQATTPENRAGIQDDSPELLDSTIMIVDDDRTTMEVVQAFLEDVGFHNFVLIEQSARAMKALEEMRPDVLLLDLIMPEVSGFQILDAIRKHPKLKHLPVLVLTSSSDPKDKLLALGIGATDFLAKPVDPSELSLRMWNTLAAKAYADQLAYYDPLTNLPNRHMFTEYLEWALKYAKRYEERLALASIELDQFDEIKDTLAVFGGDEVLRQVAGRIEAEVRSIDFLGRGSDKTQKDTDVSLSRSEGSVFTLLLHRFRSETSAARVAGRILEAIKKPLVVEDRELNLTASIGIAAYPSEDADAEGLLQLAAGARDDVKSRGGNAFQFSSREINAQHEKRLALEAGLRRALEKKELALRYQPRVDVKTGAVTGVEALPFWPRGDNRFIPAEVFIPVASESDLIIPIGDWILNEACTRLGEWRQAGKSPIGMAVDLSLMRFTDEELPAVAERIVEHSGISPELLTLVFAGAGLTVDMDGKITLMKRLKDLGFRLAVDDLGTGSFSLDFLRRLPLDEIKIDRSLLEDLTGDGRVRALVSSVIHLSRGFGFLTVADGVKTKEQLDILAKEGCDQYQGTLFSPPLTHKELFNLLPPER